MDIQLMREFIALVNLKSYRKVAQQFHIAPSTLSRHIKAIGKGSSVSRKLACLSIDR